MSHEQAAAVPLAALTAWQALVDTAGVHAGQRVLVHAAAGGVGHFAVQFAKHLGTHVIATASSARHEWLKELGADEVIDYTAVRFEDIAREVDVVIDLVGDAHDKTGSRSLEVLRQDDSPPDPSVRVAPHNHIRKPDHPFAWTALGVVRSRVPVQDPGADGTGVVVVRS
ncbi:hypothetical protein GCM10009753_48870 [Streptantibioticus ferralitis]